LLQGLIFDTIKEFDYNQAKTWK